jgi:WD40 repeat protein
MKLDYVGDKEGFFIYWLKNTGFLNVRTFYMTAKFFDAKTGIFVKMMNRPQSTLTGINKLNFPQESYFYYKVVLDYDDYTYKIYDINTGYDVLVGDSSNPIKWYEYINP